VSASEKLRALEQDAALIAVSLETPLHEAGTPSPAVVVLGNVLPQIVAVVEAAEREAPFEERGGHTGDLRRALAALEEALS
jgi:hypothetical protein